MVAGYEVAAAGTVRGAPKEVVPRLEQLRRRYPAAPGPVSALTA